MQDAPCAFNALFNTTRLRYATRLFHALFNVCATSTTAQCTPGPKHIICKFGALTQCLTHDQMQHATRALHELFI